MLAVFRFTATLERLLTEVAVDCTDTVDDCCEMGMAPGGSETLALTEGHMEARFELGTCGGRHRADQGCVRPDTRG